MAESSETRESVFEFLKKGSDWKSFKLGLDRVKVGLQKLGHPERTFNSVVVGGTNGKGSVSWNLCHAFGDDCGLFLSPHLSDVRERITIGHEWANDEAWQWAYEDIRQKTDGRFSYFEWLFLMACLIFRDRKCRVCIFEVGMGGRLDAANALEPMATVITSIGLDHTEFLGNTHREIAYEKLGICRKNVPLFIPQHLADDPDLRNPLLEKEPKVIKVEKAHGYEQNAKLVNSVAMHFGLKRKPFVNPPGRRERFGKHIVLDTAHNLPAWQDLSDWLEKIGFNSYSVLFALTGNRDPESLIKVFKSNASGFFTLNIRIENAIKQEQYLLAGVTIIDKLPNNANQPLLICGNHTLVGHARRTLLKA